jgi:site-specific DNA-methyltransferase (adenine-specific)
MTFLRKEIIGDATLYLGDNSDVLPILDRACSVVSDPPYGMDWNTDSTRFTGGDPARNNRKHGDGRSDWGGIDGDAAPFDPAPWLAFHEVILWGANHYGARLPVGSTLVWIKKGVGAFGTFLSDAEIGWHSRGHGVYCQYVEFQGGLARKAENDGLRSAHPTQKPIALMEWCIRRLGADGAVLDPFMGSGTTGVAAARQGRAFIGVEKRPDYFATACRRIEEAYRQPRLFEEPPPRPVQDKLFGDAA